MSRPLTGVRIVVGRAKHQAGALSDELRKFGADVLEIPFLEIRPPDSYQPLDHALKEISDYDWLILTSVNGVEALWDRLKELQVPPESLKHLHVAAIGPATKKAIEKRGLKVEVVPEEYVAESVVKSLKNRISGKRVLLARAKVARDVIPKELRALGAEVDVVEAYETVIPEDSKTQLRTALSQSRPDLVTFTSSSSVKNFIALAEGRDLSGIQFVSIGPVTSSTLRELGLNVDLEAEEYTIPGLVQAILRNYSHDQEASSSR